ncbi:MAG: adenylosuccinate lyase [Actinomycetota bacterium]|nr:adenylosuccinate lyase [Actinomycetota bacterium]
MIDRYSTPEMSAVWSDESKFGRWLEVELLATEAHVDVGVVPADDAVVCRATAPSADEAFVQAIRDREAITDHDVAAFVDVVQAAIGHDAAKWIHYGLTSSDVGDTALCWQLVDATDVLIEAASELLSTLIDLAHEHRDTVMIGRTHGVHAEPTTFGTKVALWAMQVDRDRSRLRQARQSIAVMKLSGAVGTYSNISPSVEAFVGRSLGLTPVPATQVIARDRHGDFLYACAAIGSTCELIAVELRHLQRTEVREAQEAFKSGQKGSSAMPHKRNPISAETISGLSRVLRSNLLAGLQDVALWHERDISHSSVERVVLPDSSQLAHYVLRRLRTLLSGLVVSSERMLANLNTSFGLVFSQPVLLELVKAGVSRDDAYRIVQRNAMQAWDEETDFRTLIERDPEVTISLDDAFDLDRSLRNVNVIFDQLDTISV